VVQVSRPPERISARPRATGGGDRTRLAAPATVRGKGGGSTIPREIDPSGPLQIRHFRKRILWIGIQLFVITGDHISKAFTTRGPANDADY